MRGFGFAAAIAMTLFAAGMSCIDVETAYQQCIDEGRCADPGADSGSPGNDSGTTGGQDAGHDAGHDSGVIDPVNDSGTTTDSGFDAGFDAGLDAGFDAGFDAGVDSGFDAGIDAGFDAGFDAGNGEFDAGFDGGDIGIDDGGTIDIDAGFGGPDGGGPGVACICPPGTICEVTSAAIPSSIGLRAIFVAGPGDVWVTGENWLVKHLEGGVWTSYVYTPTTPSYAWSINGPSSTELWQFGFAHWARQFLGGVWYQETNPADVSAYTGFAVVPGIVLAYGGNANQVYRFDGSNWVLVPSSTTGSVHSFCGTNPNNIYGVGGVGTIIAYDAGSPSFASQHCTAAGCPHFYDCSSTDGGLWLAGTVGTTGVIGQVQNGNFVPSVTTADGGMFNGMWGSSFHDVWAVGMGGTVYRRQNGSWTQVFSGTAEDFFDVWGYADGVNYEVWMVTDQGSVFQYCE